MTPPMTANNDQPTAAAFRLLFENHPVPMWVYDLKTLAFLAVNEAAEAEYGYTREEFLRLTIEDIRPVEDVEQLLAHLQQERPAFQRSGQWRHRRQDGNVIDVEITSHTIEFEGRHAALVLAQNVTEQTRVAQALAASEERYRAIFNGVQDAIVVETLDGKILAVNDRACAMYGYTHAEFLTKTVADLKPTGEPALITMAAKSLAAPLETISLRANGERFPVEISGRRQVLDGAEVLLVIVRDVTERKRAEEQLRLQSSALAAAANVIVITDRNGLIQWVNPAFTALTGYMAVEALGKTPRLLKSGHQDLKFYQEMWATILAGKVWHGEIINRRKDGSLYTEETTITPLLDASGQVTNFIAIKLDTTVRKQHERELEAIAVISVALRAAGSRTEILAVILDQLLTLLNVDGATLSILDPTSGVLTTELGRGVWAPATGLQTPPASGLSAHVLATGKPYLNNDVAHEARLLRPDLLAACRALAVAPLIAKDQVIGLLGIGSRRPISLHELQLLTSIAALAANAIQRETLQEKIAAQARQMQQIMDTVPEGVVLLDSDGHVLLANPVAARALAMLAGGGDRLTKLGGRPLTEFLTPPLQGNWHELELHDHIFQMIAQPIMPDAGEDASLEARHLGARDQRRDPGAGATALPTSPRTAGHSRPNGRWHRA